MKYILKNRKYLIVGIFLLAVISISVGYAFLTQMLNINGNAEISKTTWSIHFDDIHEYGCNSETIDPISYSEGNNQIIEFKPIFKSANDTYDFIVDMKNDGTVDAIIDSITETGNEENELIFSYTYLNYTQTNENDIKSVVPLRVGDSLPAGTTKKVRIVVTPNEKGAEYLYVTKEEKEYTLKLEITFAQLDNEDIVNEYVENTEFGMDVYEEECVDDPTEKYVLHIDPNGGVYDNHTEEFEINLWKGQTYKFLTPTKATEYDGEIPRNFVPSWEVNPESTYNSIAKSVTMNNYAEEIENVKHVYAKVKWTETNAVALIKRVENGSVSKVYYSSIQDAFNDARDNEEIYLLVGSSDDPYTESPINRNLNNITLNLNGYQVNGTLQNNGRLTLINEEDIDEVNKVEYGPEEVSYFINENSFGMINNGVFTLGIKDDYINKENLALIGSAKKGGVGLKNNGTFNFYDGYLEGFIGLDGIYNDVPEKDNGVLKDIYAIVDHNVVRDCQHVYVGPQPALVVAKTEEEIPGSDKKVIKFYFELPQAFRYTKSDREQRIAEQQNDETLSEEERNAHVDPLVVYAVAEFDATYEITIEDGEEQIFDLAGYKVSPGYKINNYGKFTIKDSSAEQGQLLPSETIVNAGDLTIDNVNINETTDKDVILNNGKINIIRSTITAKEGYAVNIAAGTEMILDEDTYLNANSYALYCNTKKDFVLQGGTIAGIHNNGNLVIKDGTNIKKMTFGDDTYGIYNSGAVSKLTLDHLNLEMTNSGRSTYAIYCDNDASQVIVDGGSLTVNSTYRKS